MINVAKFRNNVINLSKETRLLNMAAHAGKQDWKTRITKESFVKIKQNFRLTF